MTRHKLQESPRSPVELSLFHLPNPWRLETFVENLSVHRGRPITVVGEDLGETGELSGAWLAFDAFDLIVHDHTASRGRRDAIVLHEIGHILFNHKQLSTPPPLVPTLCRNNYSAIIEREAEGYATEIVSVIKFSTGHLFSARIS